MESEGDQADSEEDNEQAAVRFKVEDDPANDEKQRLHRRDTPHHLKNKRINQQVSQHFMVINYPCGIFRISSVKL